MYQTRQNIARRIVDRLRQAGHEALYAGGFVRDMLLGDTRDGDIDIATDAPPERISELFSHVVGVGEHFGVMLVVERGIPFEVATFRLDVGIADGRHPLSVERSDARGDARRRDFTINGLFYDPVSDQVLDYVDGRSDLQARIIRAIGDPDERFCEDYLRLLRAVRFASRLNFAIEEHTWQAMCRHARGILNISNERIFAELDKMLQGPCPRRSIELLDQAGILAIVMPEVKALQGVEQPPQFHPEGDVWEHTLLALSLLDHPAQILAWSTLLHDIGKPPTMVHADRIRFNNHQRVGAVMARQLLRRLKCPRALIDAVYECIDNHMNFMNLGKMRLGTLKQFLARPTIEVEIELHRVDCLASHGDVDNVTFLQKARQKFAAEQLKPVPFLRGRDLIAMGYAPGVLFGEILQAAYERQLDETLHSEDEARSWVQQTYPL